MWRRHRQIVHDCQVSLFTLRFNSHAQFKKIVPQLLNLPLQILQARQRRSLSGRSLAIQRCHLQDSFRTLEIQFGHLARKLTAKILGNNIGANLQGYD